MAPVLLPLICFGITFFVFYRNSPDISAPQRHAFLCAASIWGLLVALSSEVLGIFHLITRPAMLIFWLVACFSSIWVWKTCSPSPSLTNPAASRNIPSGSGQDAPLFSIISIAGVITIILLLGVTAFVCPPNNYDSMTYHMARVAHWIQNKTLLNYPCHVIRQVVYPPWAELAIMHLQILSHSDRFANLVQWFSMVASTFGVTLITRHLGGSNRSQIFTAVLTVTIPMGIMQATSTQNDYVTGFWALSTIYFLFLLVKEIKIRWAVLAGIALGLTVYSKGTGYVYLSVFCLWFLTIGLKRYQLKIIKPLLIVALIALLINSGYYTRSFFLTGNMLPSNKPARITNEIISTPVFFSNILRNLGLHVVTFSEPTNNFLNKAILKIHSLTGLAPDDLRTSYRGHKFRLPSQLLHEDYAGNPVHFLIIGIAALIALLSKSIRRTPDLLPYFGALTATFMLFCLYIKWQPWHSRLHLPMFVLAMPFAAIVLSRIMNIRALAILSIILLTITAPWLLQNRSKPILAKKNIFNTSRIQQYFINSPKMEYSFLSAAREVRSNKCDEVGLLLDFNSWEYPFWVLLPDTRLENIMVENISQERTGFPRGDFRPCAIISNRQEEKNNINYNGTSFIRVRKLNSLNVFLKDSSGNPREGFLSPR